MDGYDIIVHRKNNWIEPGRDGVCLNMDMENKAIKWQVMEEILNKAKDKFMNNDVPFYTVMAEAIEQINEARNILIQKEMESFPMEDEIIKDKEERRLEDERRIREMNL